MTSVFADTFYRVALTDPDDALYKQAVALEERLAGVGIVTTDEVLSEFLTFFSANPWMRLRAVQTVRALASEPDVRILPQSRESFQMGFELYFSRLDKRYSLTDCIAMATMRREGISDVLTNDRHFEQEGFHILFRGDA